MESTSYNSFFFNQGNDYDNIFYLSSSNVGLYKSNPAYQLDVAGSVNATSLRLNGTSITSNLNVQNLRAATLSNVNNIVTSNINVQNIRASTLSNVSSIEGPALNQL